MVSPNPFKSSNQISNPFIFNDQHYGLYDLLFKFLDILGQLQQEAFYIHNNKINNEDLISLIIKEDQI